MFNGIYTLWLREVKHLLRSRSQIVGSLGVPFFFLVILGFGFGSFVNVGDLNYQEFLAPGIIGMMLLFSSMFAGLSVVSDKQFGFMKEMLVAPISRIEIVLGKTLGGSMVSMIQGILVLVIALLLGFITNINPITIFLALIVMFLISVGFVSLGVAFASKIDNPHSFQIILNFFIMPLFLLSGALFPLHNLPAVMQSISFVDPLTYGVDALRLLFTGQSFFPLTTSIPVLLGFNLVFIVLAAWLFSKGE
ncbi:MAG: ABC transporter permease [archaeon]